MTDEHIKRCSMRCMELAERLGVGGPNARAMIDLVLHIQDQRALLSLADRMATAIERWDDGTGENIAALEEAIEAAKAYQKARVA
jgi:hypothetical protein